jgi:ArsR family transcriptional regulator, arsenate/arsenite/antimonite-responsive transcriptional repressor
LRQYDIEERIGMFKALSDANRLQIIDMLSCGELCACKLLEHFNITQPTLSHHMKVLADCGLVLCRKDGIWTHYSLNKERIEDFIGFLRQVTSEKEECVCKRIVSHGGIKACGTNGCCKQDEGKD